MLLAEELGPPDVVVLRMMTMTKTMMKTTMKTMMMKMMTRLAYSTMSMNTGNNYFLSSNFQQQLHKKEIKKKIKMLK